MTIQPDIEFGKEKIESNCLHKRWIEKDLEAVEGFKVLQFTCINCRRVLYKQKRLHGNLRRDCRWVNLGQ